MSHRRFKSASPVPRSSHTAKLFCFFLHPSRVCCTTNLFPSTVLYRITCLLFFRSCQTLVMADLRSFFFSALSECPLASSSRLSSSSTLSSLLCTTFFSLVFSCPSSSLTLFLSLSLSLGIPRLLRATPKDFFRRLHWSFPVVSSTLENARTRSGFLLFLLCLFLPSFTPPPTPPRSSPAETPGSSSFPLCPPPTRLAPAPRGNLLLQVVFHFSLCIRNSPRVLSFSPISPSPPRLSLQSSLCESQNGVREDSEPWVKGESLHPSPSPPFAPTLLDGPSAFCPGDRSAEQTSLVLFFFPAFLAVSFSRCVLCALAKGYQVLAHVHATRASLGLSFLSPSFSSPFILVFVALPAHAYLDVPRGPFEWPCIPCGALCLAPSPFVALFRRLSAPAL